MSEERSELERRRSELTASLPGLGDDRTDTYRRHSDALALERAGVKQQQPDVMAHLGEAEGAADEAIRSAQREIRALDEQIDGLPRRGVGAKVFGSLRRPRKA